MFTTISAIDALLDKLLDAADTLVDAVTDEEAIAAAPLYQRAAALNAVSTLMNRLMKLKAQQQPAGAASEPAPQSASDDNLNFWDEGFKIQFLDENGYTREAPLSHIGYSGKQRWGDKQMKEFPIVAGPEARENASPSNGSNGHHGS